MRRLLVHVAVILLATGTIGRGQALVRYRQARLLMGTLCEIEVYHHDAAAANRALGAALDEMQRVDRLLTNYDASSELSRMNREAPRGPFHASPELFAFVQACATYVGESEHAFDPTVGPLVRAWGFFTPDPQRPSDAAIAAARARSGFDKVRLDPSAHTVSFSAEGMELDPGGIGKGYAVDRAVRVLREHGIGAALVSAGGSTIYGLGHPPDRAWRVAVRNPEHVDQPFAFVSLADNALSTSGTSEKFVERGGRRYPHLFDPRTGEPVEHICQASVVSPTAMDSDALTKPAFVLDRDAVIRVLRPRMATHALRVEGACDSPRAVWTTPWSAGVFPATELK
jgi:FAD:protein FMN transferase